MKNLKKIVAVLLSIVVVAGMLMLPTSAASIIKDDEEIVARMYVGHKARYLNLSGHTWVYFENLTNHNITVGAYTVKPNKGVSVGTYGYSIADGRGLYYNVEAWRYRNIATTEYIGLSKELTADELETVSKRIRNSGTWDYTLNCAFFAFKIWDAIPGHPLVYIMIPTLHQLQILIVPNHDGFAMYKPKLNEIFKQVGRGDNATLVQADPVAPD